MDSFQREEALVTAHRFLVAIAMIGVWGLAGCATKETATLNIQAVQGPGMSVPKSGLSATVGSFEDARPEKGPVGVRHHLWGGETTFNVPGGKPGDVVARVMADYLRQKGWRVELAKDGASAANADILISGKVLDFSVDADSKVGRTEITVKTKIIAEATNKADGSIVRMTLNGDGSQKVVWFDPEDAQELASEVLTESLEKLVQNTKVDEKDGTKILRLK
jgi:hypothetical protein